MSTHRLARKSALPLAVFLCGTAVLAQSAGVVTRPPVARKTPHETKIHGYTLKDDYFWLREKSNPEVIAYLEAENAYTEEVMKPTEGLQETLYKEMLGRIKQTDLSVPARIGDYYYYSRTEEGKQYPYRCRRKGSMTGAEEVLLDLNELAEGHTYLGLGAFEVSDDGNWLAYSTDTTGYRQYTLHVKDLRTGADAPARRSNAPDRWSGRPTTRRCSTRRKTPSRSARTSSGGTWSAPTGTSCSTRRRTSCSTSARAARSTRR